MDVHLHPQDIECHPPLVNSEGRTFVKELPFSTGIQVMEPGFRRTIEFDDHNHFQSRTGLTRIGKKGLR